MSRQGVFQGGHRRFPRAEGMEKVFDKSLVRSGMQRRKGQVAVVRNKGIVHKNLPILCPQGAFFAFYTGASAFFQSQAVQTDMQLGAAIQRYVNLLKIIHIVVATVHAASVSAFLKFAL